MTIDISRFHRTFFEESFEGLSLMEASLLKLDIGQADSEVINSIFRAAHSIKGGAGTFGFTAIAEFTHVVETLLDEMRSGKRPVTQPAVDLFLKAVDVLRSLLTAAQDGGEADVNQIAIVRQELEHMLRGVAAPAAVVVAAPAAIPPATTGWNIRFEPRPELFRDVAIGGGRKQQLDRAPPDHLIERMSGDARKRLVGPENALLAVRADHARAHVLDHGLQPREVKFAHGLVILERTSE